MFRPVTTKLSFENRNILPSGLNTGTEFPKEIEVSADGRVIATYGNYALFPDYVDYIMNGSNGEVICTIPDSVGGSINLFGPYAVSADGSTIARSYIGFNSSTGKVEVYDIKGTLLRTINNPRVADDYFGTGIALSSDGSIIAIGAPFYKVGSLYFGRVYIYNTNTGALITTITDPDGSASANTHFGVDVVLTQDGSKVVIGRYYYDTNTFSYIRNFFVFNAVTGSLIRNISAPSYFLSQMQISGDGSRLIIGDNTKGYLINTNTGSQITDYTITGASPVRMAISADGSTIALTRKTTTGGANSYIYIFRGDSNVPVQTITTVKSTDDPLDLALNADGSVLFYPQPDDYSYGGAVGIVAVNI